MTELSPLAELATAALIPWLAGIPIAWRRTGFPEAMLRQLSLSWRIPAHIALVITGICIGIGAWIAKPVMWSAYVLVGLWSLRAAKLPWDLWQGLADYCTKRRFYRPQHAA